MSTVKSNNVQIGTSTTATYNFTIKTPTTPDGTMTISTGNSGATVNDAVKVYSTGMVQIPKINVPFFQGYLNALGAGTYSSYQMGFYEDVNNQFTVSGGNKLYPLATGWYKITVSQLIQANSQVYQHIRKNGATIRHGYYAGSASAIPVDMQTFALIYLTPSDYIDIFYAGTFQQTWGSGPHSVLIAEFIAG